METSTYILIGAAFIIGFISAWIIQLYNILKLKKEYKSTQGYLESEKLIKETLQKENMLVYKQIQTVESQLSDRIKDANKIIRRMDEDILLLQKSNEETEEMLKMKNPELAELKLKLFEAQNTIARYKAKLGEKG